jgi:vacuolar protein sorting-associated protein IST1
MTSGNAREDEERTETNHASSQNRSTPYSSSQYHSYAPESHTDMYGMPTEAPGAHSSGPAYVDDSSEKESSIGKPDDHPFDLHEERLSDAGFNGRHTKDMESRQASFNEEHINNYNNIFSASHSGGSPAWDNRDEKAGAESSGATFDQYDYDVEEDNLLDHFSSKHTEEIPTVQDHKGFTSADWNRQPKSESPVGHSTSTLFSEIETQPSYDLGANKEDIPLSHSFDTTQPTFDSDGASSDEDISTGRHAESLRSHSRGSNYSENKMFSNISGQPVRDVNDSIEGYESRSRKQYQNPPDYDAFHDQQSDGSPRLDYSGAHGNLGHVQSGDYDLSEEETEPHKLKGTSSETTRANENRPLSFRVQTSVSSDANDEGDLGLNYGRLTPGLRNKLRQPPQYKNSGENVMPKQSFQKAPSSIEESVYSKENDISSEQISDTPKSSRTTNNSVGASYSSEHYDRKHTVEKPVESRSSMMRNYFSGDAENLSQRSGTTLSPNPIATNSPVSASSSQDLRHERPAIAVRREGRSRNARTYSDSDGSEELEPRQTGQTKFSKEPIQSRRTREVTADTKRVGRVRTGAQYADETESTPKERKNPAEAFSNSSTEQKRGAPAYSRVSVQQSSPKPVRIEPPTARGKWQEDEPDESSSEDEGNTETLAGTPKESTPTSAPAHIHPKLPTDYDSFAAHFKSLRTNRR